MDTKKKLQRQETALELLKKQRQALEIKIQRKERSLNIARYGNHISTMTFTVAFDGVVEGQRVEFARGVDSSPVNFEMFMEHCMILEKYRNGGGTNLDYVIDRYAKKFRIDAEEKKRLMDIYWHKKQITIADLVKSWGRFERELFETEENFIGYLMSSALKRFEYHPLEIKLGVLYFIFKYHEKGDLAVLQKTVDETPQRVKDLVDTILTPPQKA